MVMPKGELVLYYADESHVCTNGYVPYGWQFKNEDDVLSITFLKFWNLFKFVASQLRQLLYLNTQTNSCQ